jgi:L-seryl-tRNA(Ser) seleniumtransferase
MEGPDPVNARFRQLPAVERLIAAVSSEDTGTATPRWALLAAARAVLEQVRRELLDEAADGGRVATDLEALAQRTAELARSLQRPFPRRVLNATGVVIHTNLGRAPLAREAAEEVAELAAGYSDLELDLETGERGSRLTRVCERLCLLSGAEAALVVNNNAAAVLLVVDTLAAGREVVLSRGELVEIGGSFRVPEIMASSRARLREVGTTNRTHLRDYAEAIGPDTGILLKVHPSNFEMRGFVTQVSLAELSELARERGVVLAEDRGSGTFVDLRPHGIPEPEAWAGLREGADVVTFSGDKLLGGPQAGIILGRREAVEKLRTSPLARALRVDKLTLAALDWTLRTLLEGNGLERIPALRMLTASGEVLRERAERLAKALGEQGWAEVSVTTQSSVVGGGSLPEFELPGPVVRLRPRGSAGALASRLRRADPPLIVRVQRDAILLDPRTLEGTEVTATIAVLAGVIDSTH